MDVFSHEVMRGYSELSVAHRELIATFVSALNACQFCFGSHKAVAMQYGMELKLIEKLLDNIDESNVTPRLKPILRYTRKLTLNPSQIIYADVANIIDEGWSEKTVEDVKSWWDWLLLQER